MFLSFPDFSRFFRLFPDWSGCNKIDQFHVRVISDFSRIFRLFPDVSGRDKIVPLHVSVLSGVFRLVALHVPLISGFA